MRREKYELSVGKKVLRYTSFYGAEYLYYRVTEPEKIEYIEKRSVNWKVLGTYSQDKYIVMIQLDAENIETGYYKIVDKRKADVRKSHFGLKVSVEAKSQDCMYFERRSRKK